MNIILSKDATVGLDTRKCQETLAFICQTVEFQEASHLLKDTDTPRGPYIDFTEECRHLQPLLAVQKRGQKKEKKDYLLHVTRRPYLDNYFLHGDEELSILSLANWEHYTSLPEENGVIFFVAALLADSLLDIPKHPEDTSCIFDPLTDKTGIDPCMKMGLICSSCQKKIQLRIQSNEEKKHTYNDIIHILEVLSIMSRWSRSVFQVLENKDIKNIDNSTFKQTVADYYQEQGAIVSIDVDIAGSLVDFLILEPGPSGKTIPKIVLCKFRLDKVADPVINNFSRLLTLAQENSLADQGVIVAYHGFTPDAYLAAKNKNIQLLDYNSIINEKRPIVKGIHPILQKNVKVIGVTRGMNLVDDEDTVPLPPPPPRILTKHPRTIKKQQGKQIFVIMPFSQDFDDIYYYGIRGAVEKNMGLCSRLDEQDFTGQILQEIYIHIENARLIIAEISQPNPNVFYELGYAHSLKKPVILLADNKSKTPFDVSGFNILVYQNIRDLETRLTTRLKVLLK